MQGAIQAATITWSGGGTDNNWSTTGNWNSGAGPAPGASDVAQFNEAESLAGSSPNISTSLTTQELAFSATTASGYTITASPSQTLTLTGATGTVIFAQNTSGSNTISAPMVLSGAGIIAQATGGTLNISGNISTNTSMTIDSTSATGSVVISGNISQSTSGVSVTLNGGSVLTLSGSNNFSGGVMLVNTGASLKIGNANALGTGTLTFGGGSGYTFDNVSGGTLTISNSITQQRSNGVSPLFTFTGSSGLTDTGTVTITNTVATASITVSSNTLTLSGPIVGTTGSATFGKGGAGTLALGGASTIGGGIALLAGTLELESSSTTTSSAITNGPVGTGTLTINAGTVEDNGTAITIANALSFSGTETFTSTGGGSLTFGPQSLTAAKTATLTGATSFVVNNTTTIADAISGAQPLTVGGTGTLVLSGINAYTGSTTIAAGTTRLTGSLASGTVTVGNHSAAVAILGGTGTVSGALTTAATSSGDVAYLAPGVNSSGTRNDFGGAGTLNVGGNLSLGTGTNLDFDLSSSGLSGNDQIIAAGTLTIGTALTFNFSELGSSLDTANKYQLITFTGTAPSLSGVTFGTNISGTGSYTAVYSIDGGGQALDVAFTSVGGTTPAAAFFNGQGTDLGSFANFDTSVSSGTAVSAALGTTTNVSFNADRNSTVSTATLNTGLDVNSVTFGTGAGIHSGMTINGTGTLTVEATSANGNTIGNGITVNAGGGNNAINTAVVLNNDQSWTVTDSTSTLTAGGTVSGAHMLTKAGSGVLALSGANTYSGGTTVSAGTLLASNSSGSATGSGTLTVNAGATVGGYGRISGASFSVSGTGTATGARANILVGMNSAGDTNTSQVLTLLGSGSSTIANAKLTFNLDATTAGSGTELSVGSTAISFGTGAGSVQLALNMQNEPAIVAAYTPYVLIAGTVASGGSGVNGSQYSGLTLGATLVNSGGITETIITGGNLQLAFGSSVDQQFYGANSYLVLYQNAGSNIDDIEVVVVPEPGTWALMLGGLAMLVFWQRRKSRA